jgi:hypothetical protein
MSVVHPGSLSVGRQPQEHPGVVIQQLSDGCGLVALELDRPADHLEFGAAIPTTTKMSGVRSEPVTAPTIASTVSRCFTFRLGVIWCRALSRWGGRSAGARRLLGGECLAGDGSLGWALVRALWFGLDGLV